MLRDGCQDTNGFYTFTLLKIISYVKANLNQNENHLTNKSGWFFKHTLADPLYTSGSSLGNKSIPLTQQ